MSFACHQDNDPNFFGCTSFFMPVEEEVCPLNDNVPESVKAMEKKNKITYLPGEKLLIQLSKQKKKKYIDVDRVAASLGKILPF
jgi:hypothetical protein